MKDFIRKALTAVVVGALLGMSVVAPAQAALASRIVISIVANETATADLNTPSASTVQKYEFSWATGTGASQADRIFTDERTLLASTTEDLDLAGVLTNSFGTTITFVKVRAIIVQASSLNTNSVLVGGAASAQFVNWVSDATDKVVVRPGGLLLLTAPDSTGYGVTATTADLLRIGNSAAGTSVTYKIIIIGTSA